MRFTDRELRRVALIWGVVTAVCLAIGLASVVVRWF